MIDHEDVEKILDQTQQDVRSGAISQDAGSLVAAVMVLGLILINLRETLEAKQ